jgi:ribonuclease BN (tRNA processing enzyme)
MQYSFPGGWFFRIAINGKRLACQYAQNGLVRSADHAVTVTFAGCGDAFGSGGRFQACIHLQGPGGAAPVLLDCGATSLTALRRCGLDPGKIAAVFVSHLHGDHFGGLPFLILDGQFSGRVTPLAVVGPAGAARRLPEAMECMFPGSSGVSRRFAVEVVELHPGTAVTVAGVTAAGWEVDHPSGGPALAMRLVLGGKVIAYTGDTAWTGALTEVAAGADLLIAEAYYRDRAIPFHLRHADLVTHSEQLASRRIVLTHMSADMLEHLDQVHFEAAHDGLAMRI